MTDSALPPRLTRLLVTAGLFAACMAPAAPAATVAPARAARGTTASPRHARAPRLTPDTPVTRGSGYLALGDSVTFGYQEPSVVPPPDYGRASRMIGYPALVGAALHLKVTNLACPGETSASLINADAPSLGCENGYRRLYPLHVRYRGAQLAAAVAYLKAHRGVRLVSLMIGANDGFLCQIHTSDGCVSEFAATRAAISRHVHRIVSTIRHQAGYTGQLVILHYYSLN
ncbi:MAG TPA: GDSL-type esterase/lipase family protein, partial [Solirubrobacteraceae bacterium]|nr:GDSL-type esterase/lipase family protein [Solirubrobacteraceae bacterium]